MSISIEVIYTARDGTERKGSFWSDGPRDMPGTRFLATLDNGRRRFVLVKTPTPKQQASGVKPFEVIEGSPSSMVAPKARRRPAPRKAAGGR